MSNDIVFIMNQFLATVKICFGFVFFGAGKKKPLQIPRVRFIAAKVGRW